MQSLRGACPRASINFVSEFDNRNGWSEPILFASPLGRSLTLFFATFLTEVKKLWNAVAPWDWDGHSAFRGSLRPHKGS
jgi:hypothetical protein